jgi:hypothetical protein
MIWFGYRAARTGRSLAWSLFGLLYALVFKIVFTLFAVSANFTSRDEAVAFQLVGLVIYIVGAIGLGFMLLPAAPPPATPVTESDETQHNEETERGK